MAMTPYHVTVYQLTGREDAVERAFGCECETESQAQAIFDCVTRGMRGHYRAWLVDTVTERTIRESCVTWQ